MRSGFTADDVADQSGRRFLITGANAGIGFEVARVLAARGGHVVLACRDTARADAAIERIRADAPAADLSVLPLDPADLDQVGQAAQAVLAGPTLDRSAERRVGQECVSTCRYLLLRYHQQIKQQKKQV